MLHEKLLQAFKEMDDREIISVWNEYWHAENRYDDEILDAYTMEEWVKNCDDPMNLLNRFYFGSDDRETGTSANPNRNYFTFNGYGNIISFDYIYNKFSDEFYYIEIDDLIEYIVSNEESFYNGDIQEILDEYENELDEMEA